MTSSPEHPGHGGLPCGHALIASILAASITVAPASVAEFTVGDDSGAVEAYVVEPVPPGVQVLRSERDGPVFADADGRTLYEWPSHKLRNGYAGEDPGRPACYDDVSTVTAGLMSPYPPGIVLPELDSRPSCTDLWRPAHANADAKPLERWSIVERRDGRLQWAYDEQPLYTSARDSLPGDVLGGTTERYGGDAPAMRVPVGPSPLLPPGFAVQTTTTGRMLTTDRNESVYAHADDSADETRCRDTCLRSFEPVLAPALARPLGEWTVFERSPGVHQWVFRGKPLYVRPADQHSWSQQGSDYAGWNNVYTQRAPAFPASFTVQDTIAGQVLADADGKTIYVYQCGDDSVHQLGCDHPDDTQVYRIAMCGGSQEACLRNWPYVRAAADAVAQSRSWRIVSIDPATGRFADAEQPDALRVWAYRDRPVYTFGGDRVPGDVNGDGTGEWRGQRNGLKAFWLRDDFLGRTL